MSVSQLIDLVGKIKPKTTILEDEDGDSGLSEELDLSESLAVYKVQNEIEKAQHELEELQEIRKMRMVYAGRIFWLIFIWLIAVISSVLLSGFHGKGFTLSDSVLIAFITTTTINVLGLFYIVARWLFPNNKTSSKN